MYTLRVIIKPEQYKPVSKEIFPIGGKVASEVIASLHIDRHEFYIPELGFEASYLMYCNPEVFDLHHSSYRGIGSAEFHGALIAHRMLRIKAGQEGGRLPYFNPGFVDYLTKRRRSNLQLLKDAQFKFAESLSGDSRLWWMKEHEKDLKRQLHSTLLRHLNPDVVGKYGQGFTRMYYLFKDALPYPECYQ